MGVRLGYLLPTREQVMAGQSRGGAAAGLGRAGPRRSGYRLRSGSAIRSLARPRHDPLTLLAAVAARLPTCRARHRGVAARPAQSGAAGAAGRHPRPDRRRPTDPRRGHRQRRAKYPGRVCRRRRAVRKAGRATVGRPQPLPGAVDRQAGRSGTAAGSWRGGARTDAASARWAADLGGRRAARQPGARRQAFRRLATELADAHALGSAVAGGAASARAAGRDPKALVGAMYLTLAVDD